MHSFPDPIQQEALIIFSEECSECAIEASKILRFGPEEKTVKKLEDEIGDFLCMIELLDEYGIIDLDENNLATRISYKKEKMKKWTTHISQQLLFDEFNEKQLADE